MAKRSGGPRSRDGKARASLNSLRHGLTAVKPRLLEWESAAKFRALQEALLAELQPEGVVESVLVDRITWCVWRLGRAARVEQLLLTGGDFNGPVLVQWCDNLPAAEADADAGGAQPEPSPDADPPEDEDARERERAESAALVSFGQNAGNLTRYEAYIEKSMYRALWELRETQKDRHERDKEPKRGPGFRPAA